MSNAVYEPTVALTMIVKDEVDVVNRLTDPAHIASAVFDKIIIVVSDKEAYDELAQTPRNAELYYRPWNDRFDEARNFALDKVTTDYWFWLDADDSFDFDKIPQLVQIAEDGGFDQIVLPYNYAQDEYGQSIAYHWRERLLRTSHPFTWKGWVHETPVSDVPFKAHRENVEVRHNTSEEHNKESLVRNHQILEAAVAATDDPRYQMYLGVSYASMKEHVKAINVLENFVKVSGNIEDIYRVSCVMSESAYFLGNISRALMYASQAALQIPEYPRAYQLMAQWEESQDNWHEALEWCRVAESKPDPVGSGVYSPTSRNDNILIGVHSEFMLKHYRRALTWLNKLPPRHPARDEFEEDLRYEAEVELFLELLPKQRKYFASDQALFESLAYDLRYDARLAGLRALAETPKTWSDKSIVFLVGAGYEEWGPHTLDKGMGGSEEAIIYLARELAKLGWDVTVYGAVDDVHLDGHGKPSQIVKYLPWKEINKEDTFNIFVAWRAPDFADHINAKVKLADIHDLIPESVVKPYGDVTYMFKSQYHKDQYPHLKDENTRVIGNGIVKEQFE